MLQALDKIQGNIFSKHLALRKILTLFGNKIYQAPSADSLDPTIKTIDAIKIQIAKILDFLLDLRQESLLASAVTAYGRSPLPAEWPSLLPHLNAEAGESPPPISAHCPPSFDQILNRSFLEISFVALYFSTHPSLQTMLIKILDKYSSQRHSLISTLSSTQLLSSPDSLEIYYKLRDNNIELAQYENTSQVWFLIIKKVLFEKEYERAMSNALEHVVVCCNDTI